MERDIGVDRLIDSITGDYGKAIYDRFGRTPGTPIERLFETGLHAMSSLISLAGSPARVLLAEGEPRDMPLDGGSKALLTNVYFWRQYPVLDWKVDFLIGMRGADNRPCFLVVECDGHAFHERTKEQAAKDRSRDRRLQDAGYRIHRYTGHELYKDPLGCVSDTLVSLLNLAENS